MAIQTEGSEAECEKYTEELNANYPDLREDGRKRFCVQLIPSDDANEPQSADEIILDELVSMAQPATVGGETSRTVKCENCDTPTSFERTDPATQPPEGEVVGDKWLCPDCASTHPSSQPTTPHTATPWRRFDPDSLEVVGADGYTVAEVYQCGGMREIDEADANAALIVQAVNSHAALVAALQEWYRLHCLKGLDPNLRNGIKRHAANLTRDALRLAGADQFPIR